MQLSTEQILKQLTFIKYLYYSGSNEAQKKSPLSSVAILQFHDSVELFLELASDAFDANTNNANFMGYWQIIEDKLKGTTLSFKEPMRKLNEARNSLKHSGNKPSQSDIDGYRINTKDFLIENSTKLFSIDFEEVSLSDLIPYANVKEHVKKAEELAKAQKYKKAAFNYAISYKLLVKKYTKNKNNFYGENLFDFGDVPEYEKIRYLGRRTPDIEEGQKKFNRKVEDSLKELYEALDVLALGINYKKFLRFDDITPDVYLDASNSYQYSYKEDRKKEKQELDFCKDFIIETSLNLYGDEFTTGPDIDWAKKMKERMS